MITVSPGCIRLIALTAAGLRTPSHTVVPSRSRSSMEYVRGSVFARKYAIAVTSQPAQLVSTSRRTHTGRPWNRRATAQFPIGRSFPSQRAVAAGVPRLRGPKCRHDSPERRQRPPGPARLLPCLARPPARPACAGKRRQGSFEFRAQVLELRRKREPLTQMLRRLIGREPGADRRNLKEDPAWLAEVDRAKVKAVDDRGRMAAALEHTLPQGGMVCQGRVPGDVVHRARPARAAGRVLIIGVECPPPFAPHLEAPVIVRSEAERLLEEPPASPGIRAVGAHAVEPLERQFDGDLRMAGPKRGILGAHGTKLESEPLGVLEAQILSVARGSDAVVPQPVFPEAQRVGRGDAPRDPVRHSRAGAAALGPRVLEEREVRAGAAVLIGVEQVIDGRIILVHRFLDQPQAEQPGVKVDVSRRIRRDRGDVVNPVESHGCTSWEAGSNAATRVPVGAVREALRGGPRKRRGMPTVVEKRRLFRELHRSGCFVIPNPWDVGTARYLQHLGFKALATTSSGAAFSMGLPDADWALTRDPMLEHIRTIVDASDVPVNADFESGYADDPDGVAENVRLCVETDVAGLSIEDSTGDASSPLYPFDFAVARVRAARAAIDGAGADCLYAPGIRTREQIAAVVRAVAPKPVNLLIGGAIGLTVKDAAELGVRRISVGGALARAAWGGFMRAAQDLVAGRFDALAEAASGSDLNRLFTEDLRRRTR